MAIGHGVDLVMVHGDVVGRDDVAKVGHRPLCEGTLCALEAQLVIPKNGEDSVDVLKM